MSDIKIIIKIPEEKFRIIKNKMYCGLYDPDLYEAIAKGTPLDKTSWTPVDDASLPENLDNVLVTDGEDVFIGWRRAGKWYSDDPRYYEFSHPITAWIPWVLPGPYKEKNTQKACSSLCKGLQADMVIIDEFFIKEKKK